MPHPTRERGLLGFVLATLCFRFRRSSFSGNDHLYEYPPGIPPGFKNERTGPNRSMRNELYTDKPRANIMGVRRAISKSHPSSCMADYKSLFTTLTGPMYECLPQMK